MRTDLVLDALEMANGLRQPEHGLMAHSDRGSQYTSVRYTERLEEIGAAPSVGSKGDAYDDAMAEGWVATYKSELVDGRCFPSYEHAEHETQDLSPWCDATSPLSARVAGDGLVRPRRAGRRAWEPDDGRTRIRATGGFPATMPAAYDAGRVARAIFVALCG